MAEGRKMDESKTKRKSGRKPPVNGKATGAGLQEPADKAPAEDQTAPENPVQILVQYIKDLSFENPHAPQIFAPSEAKPVVDISVNVDLQPVDQLCEVILVVRARVHDDKRDHFLVEMKYAGLVQLNTSLKEELHNPALLIEAPRLLFPFARNILADATRDGGFPPLFLQPIDFAALYRRELTRRMAGNENQPAEAKGAPGPKKTDTV